MKAKTSSIITTFSLCLLLIAFLMTIEGNVIPILNKAKPIPISETEVYCLTRNAYYEARGDSEMSQIAVTQVVLNRMMHSSYPANACEVVYQKNRKEHNNVVVCQFSWYCDKRLMKNKVDEEAWDEAYTAVRKALSIYYHKGVDVTQGSTFYHAYYVNPGWRHLEKVTKIGSHIYYRESDNNGTTGRLAYEKVVFRTN